jgi:hypothetical protein
MAPVVDARIVLVVFIIWVLVLALVALRAKSTQWLRWLLFSAARVVPQEKSLRLGPRRLGFHRVGLGSGRDVRPVFSPLVVARPVRLGNSAAVQHRAARGAVPFQGGTSRQALGRDRSCVSLRSVGPLVPGRRGILGRWRLGIRLFDGLGLSTGVDQLAGRERRSRARPPNIVVGLARCDV